MDYDTGDISVRLIPMPTRQHAACVVDGDGYCNIYLNQNDTREQNIEAFQHELEHIKGRDWLACESADSIEYEKHKKECLK